MRSTKNNDTVKTVYYRPEQKRCPVCHWKLKRQRTLWHKYLTTMAGRIRAISQGYRCSNPACEAAQTTYRSNEAEGLSVPGCGYGLDVIVEVGYQRFWQQRTVAEIHAALPSHVKISERQVLNLLANFLALLRAGQGAKIAGLKGQWQELGGLVLALDGMQPEKGSPALYVVREAQLGITLKAEALETADQQTLAQVLLEPIKSWDLPVKGIVSDAQESIRLAVAQVYPNQPHQCCQFHCLKEAGRPGYEQDRALKTRLKKRLRPKLRYLRTTIYRLAADDPYRPVLVKYVQLFRFALLIQGLPPFKLGGVQLVQQLTLLEASLRRAREKGGIGCWTGCSNWPGCTTLSLTR